MVILRSRYRTLPYTMVTQIGAVALRLITTMIWFSCMIFLSIIVSRQNYRIVFQGRGGFSVSSFVVLPDRAAWRSLETLGKYRFEFVFLVCWQLEPHQEASVQTQRVSIGHAAQDGLSTEITKRGGRLLYDETEFKDQTFKVALWTQRLGSEVLDN